MLGFARRHPFVIAYVVAIVPATVMALTQPVWSLVDEAHHFDFIAQLGHGTYPVADATLVTAETVAISQKTGVYRAFYPPGSYPVPDLADIHPPPPGMTDAANAVWMQRHMWQLSREAIQTPGYYLLMVPAWLMADATVGPFAAVLVLRLINALILAALAPMAVAAARLLAPGQPALALLAAVFTVLLPGLELNLSRISNDTLSAAVGGGVVLLALRWAASAWTWRRVALAGLLLGAGMLIKLTLAGLLPALAISMLWPSAGTSARRRVVRAGVAVAIAVVCLVPWFLINLHLYGGLTSGARGARLSDAIPHSLTADFIAQDLVVFFLTYWSGEPWGTLPLSAAFTVVGVLITLMALLGLLKVVREKTAARASGPTAVAAAAVVSMTAVTLALPSTLGFEFLGPGRYAYPALPAAAALCALGVMMIGTSRLARSSVTVGYALLAVVMLTWGALAPPSAARSVGRPPAAATVVNVDASGSSQGLAVHVDRVARDPIAGATWFHVTATNTSSEEIEWSVPGDYSKSTRFPGNLDPGQSVSGWLYVPVDPSRAPAAGRVELRFGDIALPEYRALGVVDIQVSVT